MRWVELGRGRSVRMGGRQGLRWSLTYLITVGDHLAHDGLPFDLATVKKMRKLLQVWTVTLVLVLKGKSSNATGDMMETVILKD